MDIGRRQTHIELIINHLIYYTLTWRIDDNALTHFNAKINQILITSHPDEAEKGG